MIALAESRPLTQSQGAPRQLRSPARVLEQRHDALLALDAEIAPRLPDLVPSGPGIKLAARGLTAYDAILPGCPDTGGHWNVAALRMGWLSHTLWSRTLLLDFDAAQAPRRLRIIGWEVVVTEDLSPSGLERAFAAARRVEPLRTTSAHAFTGISL